MYFETRAIHAGSRGPGHAPPIDLSTTWALPSMQQGGAWLDELVEGKPEGANPVYARLGNPTVRVFEERLAELEQAEDAVAFASGMAAVTAVLLAGGDGGQGRGAHIVGVRPLYGGTHHLLESGLLGTDVTWVDPQGVRGAIRPDTRLVFLETPANPTLREADIRAVVDQAGHVPVCVDSTFATPFLQNPLTLGATWVLHSATKFLGGHGDVLGGIVATTAERAAALRQVRILTGAVLHPMAGYLLARGLTTLPVRMRAQQASASELARWLDSDPRVHCVYYPGLTRDRRGCGQMRGGGAIVSLSFGGDVAAGRRFVEALQLMLPAVSVGSVDTLVQMPADLTHRIVDPQLRQGSGIPEDLVRISVGLEALDDLKADLDRALAVSAPRAGGFGAAPERASEAATV